ncbi:MAG: DUF2125 domain-containing protein [Aestuariivita sp.]|nr:DUF2125 domain-containing protein [Aestuariivita sp.]
MTTVISRSVAYLCAMFLLVSAVQANITAQEAWSAWKLYYTDSGLLVQGTEQQTANVLIIHDVILSAITEDKTVAADAQLGTLRFTQVNDERVDIQFSNSIPIVISVQSDVDNTVRFFLSYDLNDFEMSVTGSQSDMTFNYRTSSAILTLDRYETEIDRFPVVPTLNFIFDDLTGSTRIQNAETPEITSSFTSESTMLKFSLQNPDETSFLSINGRYDNIAFDSTSVGTFPLGMDTKDFVTLLDKGLMVTGSLMTGPSSLSVIFKNSNDTLNFQNSMDRFALSYDLSKNGLGLKLIGSNGSTSQSSSENSFPIGYQSNGTEIELLFPITAQENEQDFEFLLNLDGFRVSEAVWEYFDPKSVLVHDAAHARLNISGRIRLLADLFDFEDFDTMSLVEQMPVRPTSISIKELSLSALGVELIGNGAVTFNEALQAIGGMNLMMKGFDGLLNTLVRTGFLSEGDASGIRFSLDLMAESTKGEDKWISQIEFKDGGQIVVNGQRIR